MSRSGHTDMYRQKCLKQKINVCAGCGTSDGRLIVHHIDGDRMNNRLDNLTPMCDSCHRKIHSHKPHSPVLNWFTEQLPEDELPHIRQAPSWSERDKNIKSWRTQARVVPAMPEADDG